MEPERRNRSKSATVWVFGCGSWLTDFEPPENFHPKRKLIFVNRPQCSQTSKPLNYHAPTSASRSWASIPMNDGFIRNREGKIIGKFDGNWLRDGTGKLVARYDKWNNRTRDRNGRIIGDGDQRLRSTDVFEHIGLVREMAKN